MDTTGNQAAVENSRTRGNGNGNLKDRRGITSTDVAVVALAALLVLYVLSWGPVAAYYTSVGGKERGTDLYKAVDLMYRPLGYVMNAIPFVSDASMAYMTVCKRTFFSAPVRPVITAPTRALYVPMNELVAPSASARYEQVKYDAMGHPVKPQPGTTSSIWDYPAQDSSSKP